MIHRLKFLLFGLLLGAAIVIVPLVTKETPAFATAPETPEIIDTLDYFVSKHLDKTLNGSHNQNQVVAGNISYYVKWEAAVYEVHTWDDDYIYLREDHGWQYDKGYAFRPGRWMKRSMKIGEAIAEPNNLGYYFNYNGCELTNVSPAPYTMVLEKHVARYNMGGDLGRQEVIVLKYDYSTENTPGNFERFYYSKEWGWVKWELYNHNKLIKTSIFNEISDPPTVPDINSSCTHTGAVIANDDQVVYPLPVFRLLTGKVVRAADSSDLFYITQQAQRQYVCNSQVLINYGLNASDTMTVPREELNFYQPLAYVRLADAVYKLEGEQKHRVDPGAFAKYNIDLATLPAVTAREISCYNLGSIAR